MPRIAARFRGFLPVVVDVETGGFNPKTDALLEIAACILRMDDFGRLVVSETISVHVEPFDGANIDPKSLEITGIRLDSLLRGAVPEKEALSRIAQPIRKEIRVTGNHAEHGHKPLDREKTINSMVIDLTAKAIHIAWGNPCVNLYHTYYLE